MAVAAAGSFTGLQWRSDRAGDVVRARSLRIDAVVQADGWVLVTETLVLDGTRPDHLLARRVPRGDSVVVAFRDATDDDGRPVAAISRTDSDGNLTVRFAVGDRAATVLHYAVLGAVRSQGGQMVVAMYWLNDNSELAIDELAATIGWPDAGPPSAAGAIVDGRRIEADRLAPEVRFEASAVPAHAHAAGAAAFGAGAGAAGGVAVEGQLARLAPPRRGRDGGPWSAMGVVAGVIVLVGWALLQWRRGTEHPVPAVVDQAGLPSSHTPAEVGWLLRFGSMRHGDLTATLIHLSSRGYVIPHRREGRLVVGRGRPSDELRSHEQVVLDWLFPGIVLQCDLEARNAEIRRDPDQWAAMWRRFVAEVRSVGRSSSLVEREAESAAVVGLGFVGLLVVTLGVAGVAASHMGWIACVLAGAVVVSASTAFARRSPEGALLAAQWEAFGRSLADAPDAGPEALAYAVVLHEHDAAAAVLDAHGLRATATPWPAQLIDREVRVHVDQWRMSYLVATSVKGEPSERLRAVLSLRALRRRSDRDAA